MKRLAMPLLAAIVVGVTGSAHADDAAGYLGVHLQRIDEGLAEALDRAEEDGVLIRQVEEDSPAADAGLKPGDILTAIDGETLSSPGDVRKAIRGHAAGETAEIRYLRDGDARTAKVELGEAPDRFWAMESFGRRGPRELGKQGRAWARELRFAGERGYFGVMAQPVSGDLAEYFGVEGGGALVAEIVEDSPAEKLGLKAGDVITSVAGEPVEGPDDLRRVIRRFEEPESVEVVWTRDGKEKKGTVELEVRESTMFGLADGDVHRFLPDLDHLRHSVDVHRFDRGELDETLETLRRELDELREELESMRESK